MGSPLDAFFESYYRLRPVNATFTGVHDFDGAYPDWSPDGVQRARAEMESLRRQLHPVPRLGSDEGHAGIGWAEVDADLADDFLAIQLRELDGWHFQRGNPSLAVGEAVFGIISLMTRPFAPAADRMESAAARLLALPRFLEGAQASLLERPVRAAWRQKALTELGGARTLLVHGIERWIAREGSGTAARAVLDAAPIALAAVQAFADWLRSAPAATNDDYACGADLFELLMTRGHRIATPVDDLRKTLRALLVQEQARLDDRARSVHSDGWAGVRDELALRHPTAEGYYAAFEATWRACRDVAVAHELLTWPDYPIRYVPIPEWTRDAAPSLYYLFYRSPAPFDRVGVTDYVVTPLDALPDEASRTRHLRAWNDSVIKLNHVVHHGAIGHHVQNFHAFRSPSRIGQIAGVDCASRIGMFSGGTMTEGWACYATDLMDEVGFLTPFESVAEQHSRVRMLARAIVDIELHTGRIPLAEGVRFYEREAGMPAEAALSETVKNSMFPGTASMYWLGTQALHRLRAECASVSGESFSLRRFHDTVLCVGAIPVAVAHEIVLRRFAARTDGNNHGSR
ncbi:MAG: hypothetical protein MNPFHGCM_02463 [Gemmatimonadaceae bacterium]|nr:hypothetical protein [Gemmatimonadaceae bacterium]